MSAPPAPGTRCRLAVLASHPIQYFTPVYRRLAAHPELDLEVMFYSDYGVRPRYDKLFGRAVQWDTDQLSGYRSRFLTNVSPVSDTFTPLHAVNPGVFFRMLGGFDAVWLNGYMYPSNWMAALGAALRGTRVLFRSELTEPAGRGDRPVDRARDAVIRAWVRRSDALLYIGEANRRAYLSYDALEHQLYFAPYSVDVERIGGVADEYAPAAKRAELREKWQVPADGVVALYVGKLIERKHPEAMLDLAEALPHVRVVIAGSGPMEVALRADAERRALANVHFLGFVNQSVLPEVYALADLFVMPSEDEPWGLVLNEAMAAGLPGVASDRVGAVPDLIADGRTGYVVEGIDVPTFVDRVGRLAADSALRRTMGAAARARSSAYSYEATAAGVIAALRGTGAMRPGVERRATPRTGTPSVRETR